MLTAFDRYSLHKHWYSATTRKASPPTWHRHCNNAVLERQLVASPAHAVGDVFPSPRRRTSQTTATVPARPPPGLQPVARPRWCRLGCVSHNAAARPPRRSLIVARSRRRACTRRLGSTSPTLPAGTAPTLLLTSSATSFRVAARLRAAAVAAPPRVAARHCTPVRAALSALRRARRRCPPAVTSSTAVVGNTAKRCRPPASQPRRPRRWATSSATSLCVAARSHAATLAAPLHTAER